MVRKIIQRHHLKALFIPPSIIEQLLVKPEGLNNVKDLE